MHVFPFANKRNAVIGLVLTLACSFIGQALAGLPGLSLIGHLVLALMRMTRFSLNPRRIMPARRNLFAMNPVLSRAILVTD